MAAATRVIFADRDAWRVAVVPRGGGAVTIVEARVPPDAAPDVRADALREALNGTGRTSDNVVLALASENCLCAPVSTAGLPGGRQQRGQAMLYRLEEKIPLAAEDVAADFLPASADDRALGVCVERRVLHSIVATVEAAGVRIVAICPAALLACQHWSAGRPAPGAAELVLWAGENDGGNAAELFGLDSAGAVVAWHVLPSEPRDVALHARMAAGAAGVPTTLVACGVTPGLVAGVREAGVEVTEALPVDVRESAARAADAVARGRMRPWVEVSGAGGQQRLGRGAGRWAMAATLVLAASVAAALFVRAARYERLAAQYVGEQAELFRRALPGQPVPGDVRSRLASEARASGQVGPGNRGPGAHGAAGNLVALRDVMTHLPADVRFRVYELRVAGDGSFTLEGEAPSHGDADGVAVALRRRAGFDVEPPRTEQRRGQAVAFTINGSMTDRGASR